MSASLAAATLALRPVRAALVGAPAIAGWVWAGGTIEGGVDCALVALGAWSLALGAFAWNDRADQVRGIAARHPSPRVRALDGAPGSGGWLLGLGCLTSGGGILCWTALGPLPGCLGVAVAASGWLYSEPGFFGKGRPRIAPVLHLLGGGANAAAGALAGGAEPVDAAAWAAACGLLFVAAHRIHMVGDRDADLTTGVVTLATIHSPAQAALRARSGLALVAALIAVGGLVLGDAGGAGLIGMGLALAIFLALAAPGDDPRRGSWRRFQRRCPVAGAAAALGGVAITVMLRGAP